MGHVRIAFTYIQKLLFKRRGSIICGRMRGELKGGSDLELGRGELGHRAHQQATDKRAKVLASSSIRVEELHGLVLLVRWRLIPQNDLSVCAEKAIQLFQKSGRDNRRKIGGRTSEHDGDTLIKSVVDFLEEINNINLLIVLKFATMVRSSNNPLHCLSALFITLQESNGKQT
jgi:hypothetical protein